MNKFFKWFTYKKVATITIECSVPSTHGLVVYTQRCHLYENPFAERKASSEIDYFPLACLRNYKTLVERFLNGQCTPEIPSYSKIHSKEVEPAKFQDTAFIC